MNPVDYILIHRDRSQISRSDVGRLFVQVGQERYGATVEFRQEHAETWFQFKNQRPRWFYAAALDIALEHDWRLESLDDARYVVRTIRALEPTAPIQDVFAKLGDSLPTDHRRLIEAAWLHDTQRKPSRLERA